MDCVICQKRITSTGVKAGPNKRVAFHYRCVATVVDQMLDDDELIEAFREACRRAKENRIDL